MLWVTRPVEGGEHSAGWDGPTACSPPSTSGSAPGCRHSAVPGDVTYRRQVLSATSRPLTTRRLAATTTALLALALAGCSGAPSGSGTSPAASSPASSSATSSATPSTASASPGQDAAAACVSSTVEAMTPEQRLGQLFMVGFDTNAPLGSLDDLVRGSHVGNVIYLGGWDGAEVDHVADV